MLSPDIIARIKALDLKGRRMASDLLTGQYTSAFHGRGMEFHEVREYVPGDDVRGIDWNVTARMNQPFIKVFREERELTIMLLVDVSASLFSGDGRSRREAAAEMAAIIAWMAQRSNDRVGLILFGDTVELFVPPRKGRVHIWRIIRDLLTWSTSSRGTRIDLALDHLVKMIKRRAVCFVISDFLVEPPHRGILQKSLVAAARQHDLTGIHMTQGVLDGLSPQVGLVTMIDQESGEVMTCDTSDQKWFAALKAEHLQREGLLKRLFDGAGASLFAAASEYSMVDPLASFLQNHRAVRSRRRA